MKKREMSIAVYLVLIVASLLLAAGVASILGWTHYEIPPYGETEQLVIKRSSYVTFTMISMCCTTAVTIIGILMGVDKDKADKTLG